MLSSILHPVLSNLIQGRLLLACHLFVKLPSFLSGSSGAGIASKSTCAIATLASTPSETLFLLVAQHAQTPSKAMTISSCTLLRDPYGLLPLLLVHPMRLSLPPILSTWTKSMFWTYLLIHLNLFSSSQLTALLTSMDSYISRLAANNTRRPISKGSHLLYHLLLPPILLIKVTFRSLTFQLLLSLATSLSLSPVLNLGNIFVFNVKIIYHL
jgi:hypothetical protein